MLIDDITQYVVLDLLGIQKKSFFQESPNFPGSVCSTDFKKVSHSLQLCNPTSRSTFKDFENIVLILPYYNLRKISKKHSENVHSPPVPCSNHQGISGKGLQGVGREVQGHQHGKYFIKIPAKYILTVQ